MEPMEPTFDLASCLALIPDRRRAEGKMHGQVGVILFSIIAMLSGARSYRQIHALLDRRLAILSQEDRCVAVYLPGSALDETEWASLIAAVVRVERNTLIRSAATGQWTTRRETAFYASSVVLPAETRRHPQSPVRSKTRTTGCAMLPSPRTPAASASTRASWRDCAVRRSTSPVQTA